MLFEGAGILQKMDIEKDAEGQAREDAEPDPRGGRSLEEILGAAPLRPYDVIVLPIIPWEFRFQRPQQIAAQFGRHGHRVFYLSLTRSRTEPSPVALNPLAENVSELVARPLARAGIYDAELAKEDCDRLEEDFASLAEAQDISRAVCLVHLPFWTPLARRLRERFGWPILYDCLDDWAGFPGIGPAVVGAEPDLVRSADLTIVASEKLLRKWQDGAARILLVPSGVDLAHYQARFGPSELLGDVLGPVIGYFGAIASWVDVPLLEKIARRFPDATLVLAGERFDVDLGALESLPNVRLLGDRPYEEMPALLWRFDVSLIPLLVNDMTEASNQVKLYEYCFGGRPIVATELSDLRPHGGFISLARGHEEFLELVARALEEPSDDPRRIARRRLAAASDWEARYLSIDKAIGGLEAASWSLVSSARLPERFEREIGRVKEALRLSLWEEFRSREDEALTAAREELPRLERTVKQVERELDDSRGQLHATSRELLRIQTSRLWRTASVYWAVRRRLRRLRTLFEKTVSVSAPSASLSEAVPVAATNRHDVLCFPIIEWDFRFQRPQQLMSRFAEAGHRVFFVATRLRPFGEPFEIRRKAENIYEVSLKGPNKDIYRDSLTEKDVRGVVDSLNALRRELSLTSTAVFVQLPFWWPIARRTRDRFLWPIVYDCMDHHAGFATNRSEMLVEEKDLLASADLVLASSALLEGEARRFNRRVLLLRNACDYDHFAPAGEPAAARARPVIGYYGAIAEWFDADLVADIAEKRPDWRFVLIGSTYGANTSRLAELPNVELSGEKPYARIPLYLAGFDVALLPFKRTPLTEATNPVKCYEILAAGKPLVAVPLPEIVPMAPHVRLASSADEFEREIEAALAERDTAAIESRRAFARENTWAARFEQLAPAVAKSFPLVSIVIVTYNNVDLNRLCLESIFEQTSWPNFEVFVVDNASTDGTREFLGEAGVRWPNVRVILNDSNLGFAAANNLALKEARGEFLVLLNNDVVVPRGWLSTLLRHLRARPDIGMIGPVTNAIGNEARVEVGYHRVEEMPRWAERYTRDHDGDVFEIPMLAMFCVAMRRTVFDKVGFLDERFGIGMFEDDDYALRIKNAGYRLLCARDSFVHHWMKASFRKMPGAEYRELFERNRKLFEEKWGIPWVPHRGAEPGRDKAEKEPDSYSRGAVKIRGNGHGPFAGMAALPGRCNICGSDTAFYFNDPALYRESLNCAECLATSRYRSIARGILKAVRMLTGVDARSLAELPRKSSSRRIAVYETQVPFRFSNNAYPIPELLGQCPWIDLTISRYRPRERPGKKLGPKVCNQNLEELTFPDDSFDIVITSDVLEHVRLDDAAHAEIRRVLKPGGIYVFTVPHFRTGETLVRVKVHDPKDPSRDEFVTEKEFHGDANSEGGGALSYRAYGTDLDERLAAIGFEVEYSKEDFPELGIFNTELFFCRLRA